MWPTGVGSRLPCPRDSALRRAALGGNVLAVSPHHIPTGRSVRVFISANPDDTEAERSALKEHVYPKLREFCRENYGIEFQVVDLYWGIDPEEWDNPELQRMRMKLLEECLKTSSGPCFVGLLGEKYGSIRIPGEVESAEFEMILDSATEAGLDTRILEECYCRDENAVPPAYYLKPKSEILKNLHNSMESANRNLQNDKSWQNIADGIKKVFKTAVSLLQEKGTMKNSQAKRFLCSALEDELDFALGKQTPAFLKKCVCYIRKIANFDRHAKLPEMGRYMDTVTEGEKIMRNQEAYEKLIKLRDEFIPTIVASSNLRVYTSVTHCDMKLGYSEDVENHYVEGLCKQFYEDMVDIIQATVQQNFDTEMDPLYDEVLQHLSLCKTYATFFEYRCEALSLIHKYILPSKAGRINPLIVYGGPCTGKTLLLAEVAKQKQCTSGVWQRSPSADVYNSQTIF
ncbi:NACHT and WD repeat domain-containing protein 2 isoform X2 [Lepisosteus oculatus]|uniref:NACHT and WD repeat domain-containing protein 2 isoform X2 n=1 Tax=Lepisosteus oculatus TaxID=7918 RepID=UPI00074005DA|nr:PREDICTED: NACHT and WD repeat domain-containing protein 2 isoform X4 [Lepisosteus oculatus]